LSYVFVVCFLTFGQEERDIMGQVSVLKRKQLWIAVAACCGVLAAGTVSTNALAAPVTEATLIKPLPALTGWNLDNAKTVNPDSQEGRTWLYPDAATAAADTAGTGVGSRGFVIWELDDSSGRSPGIQVRTNEPLVYALRNCIMASGERAGVSKTCYDEQSSSKRFKLRVTGSETEPVDLVFNAVSNFPYTYDAALTTAETDVTGRIYRVFLKWANYTKLRAQGFKVVLGFGTGDNFKPATGAEGVTWEVRTLVPQSFFGATVSGAQPLDREVWKDEELGTFSPGQYAPLVLEKDGTTVRFYEGFFDKLWAGLITPPLFKTPTLIYSGDTPSAWAIGAITQNYFSRWGYMLNYALLPTGIYEDPDGDPATEGELRAFWDGANWRYGQAAGFAVVPDSVLATWGALPLGTTPLPGPRYYKAVIDDLGGLNSDIFINLDESYKTAVSGDKITLRVIPVAPADGIAGNEANPPWLATPAPALPTTPTTPTEPTTPTPTVPVESSGGGGGGCTIGNDGRFDPTLPAMLFAGLGFLGWRRYKAGK
jgi:hypothetical protein